MSWYKVTYRQIEPIHLGYKKHGVINETRIFITGQAMWGALSNAYGQLKGWSSNDYQREKNQKLFENISCFYPMIEDAVMYPRFEDGELYLGKMSERAFRQHYVTTLVSTAISPSTLHAKDESLHELDVIVPKNLHWVGYIKCNKEQLEKLNEIRIGSDSRYGLGLMKLESLIEESYAQSPKKGVITNAPNNEPLSNFIKFDKQKFEGKLELLAEFDFRLATPELTEGAWYLSVGTTNIS